MGYFVIGNKFGYIKCMGVDIVYIIIVIRLSRVGVLIGLFVVVCF